MSVVAHTTARDIPAVPVNQVEQFLRLLHADGEVFEIRALKVPGGRIVSGYYTDPARAARDILGGLLNSGAGGIYVTLNPINRDALSRSAHKLTKYAETTTRDDEILSQRWLLIDFDAERLPGISATEQEAQTALERAERARVELAALGWPQPALVASGNGAHLLYRMDLPNDPASKGLVRRVLSGLAQRYSDEHVKIDESVFNAARITKIAGTWARKGDSTPERPHRQAQLLSVPDELQVVTRAQLEQIAAPTQQRAGGDRRDRGGVQPSQAPGHIVDIETWLQDLGVSYKPKSDAGDCCKFELERCPWADHAEGWKAWILQNQNGEIRAGCQADRCRGRGFREMRDALQPGWRSIPRTMAPSVPAVAAVATVAAPLELEEKRPDADALTQELLEGGSIDVVFRASARLGALPKDEYGRVKAALKRVYGKTLNLNDLDAAVRVMRVNDAEEKSGQKLPLTKIIADAIAELGERFAVDAGGTLWVYRDGVYVRSGAAVVKRRVKELLNGLLHMPEEWSTHQADEVVAYIAVDAPELWERPPVDRVNLRNGILTLSTRKLAPHSPYFLSPVQLPISYDPAATCPAWERFVATTFPEDTQLLAWEIFAHLMTPDTSIQKAILLLGEGGNGKSTYLAGVTAFLGKANISAIPLQKLEADRFVVSRLVGKLANICADLPSAALTGTSMFKAITGGDAILAEDKFKASFDLRPFARLLFSANKPPQSPDASQAFYDRWIAIPFTGRFRGESEEIDRDTLDAALADPRELSGVLNKALEVWPQLKARRRFSESESTRAELASFREVTDPLTIWLNGHTLAHPDAIVSKEDLWRAYVKHAQKQGFPTGTQNAFGRALKRARPSVSEAQRTWRGREKTWVWVGIGLTSPDPGKGSRGSRDSLDSLYLYSTHAHPLFDDQALNDEEGGVSPGSLSKANPVNPVNPVTPAECSDSDADSSVRKRLRAWAKAHNWQGLKRGDELLMSTGEASWEAWLRSQHDTKQLERLLQTLEKAVSNEYA